MVPQNIVVIILFTLLIIYLPFIYLFFQRRYIQPIVGRTPLFILILDLSLYLLSINELFISCFADIYPLALRGFLGFFPYLLAFTIYDCRLLNLLFAYKITDHVMKHRELQRDTWQPNWYSNNRWFVAKSTYLQFFLIQNFLYFVFYILMFSIPLLWTSIGTEDLYLTSQYLFWNIVVGNEGIFVIIMIILGYKLKDSSGDAFKIKTEIVITCYTSGSALLCYGVFFALGFVRAFATIAVLVAVHSVLITGTVWPWYLSLQNSKTREVTSSSRSKEDESKTPASRIIQLIDILKTQEGFQAFLEYSKTEFSSENLLFWEQVENLKKIQDLTLLQENVIRIFQHYCLPNSPCQINLPHEIRENIYQSLELIYQGDETISINELRSIYDIAQQNIFDLMNHDSFARFQKISPYYLRLLENGGIGLLEVETSGLLLSGNNLTEEVPSPSSGFSSGSSEKES